MTTYQDPAPLSRRAARQSERAQAEARETAERDGDDSAFRLSPGRRAMTPQPSAPAEPLAYVTQSRPNLPSYEGPSFRSRSITPGDAGDAMPATQVLSTQDRPSYRPRDYSPEARRASATLAPSTLNPSAARGNGDLDYFTQGGPGQLVMAPPALRTDISVGGPLLPAAPGVTATDPVPHATLTRRELRALRAATQTDAPQPVERPTSEAVDFLLRSGPIDLPKRPAAAAESAASGPPAGPIPLVEPAPRPVKYPSFTDLIGISKQNAARRQEPKAESAAAAPSAPLQPAGVEDLFSDSTPTAVAPVVGSPKPSPAAERPAPTAAASEVPEDQAPGPVRRASAFPNWTQSEDDDSFPAGYSRGFGSGSTGSIPSALVMPTVPNPSELSYSLSTGEILVTGSIDLPRSLGATGAHPDTLDDAIDHLLDAEDEERVSSDSSPVRAIRAVSSHTSTRGMIAAHKPKGNKLPTVLAVSASAMAVVVLTLGIVSVATGSL